MPTGLHMAPDYNGIYIFDIFRFVLSSGLSFTGYIGFGNF